MRRGWSSFADTWQKTQPTSSIRPRVFPAFAAMCRRRWPSGRRPQAPQRLWNFRNAARCDILIGESRDELRRRLALVELAEPACLGTANPHLSDLRICERLFVEFGGAAGRKFRRGGSASRTRKLAPEPLQGGRECFCVFRGEECRRRCPSRGRQQAPQRPSKFTKRGGTRVGFSGGMRDGEGRRTPVFPSPQATRNHPRNTGTLIRGSGDEFSRSGDEWFEDFHPIPTERGRENIFRGLARTSDQRTRDRFSTQPRNEGSILPETRRDFQTTS